MHEQETEWLRRAQDGDDEAFASLVEAYQTPVYNLCYRMLGNAGDAEDAAQESFFRAYKALKRYDPQRKFSTWLLSIASNYCIDQYRRRRSTDTPLDELPGGEMVDDEPGVESAVVTGEQGKQLHNLLGTLAPKDRAAIVMYYWHDHSYEEIAGALSLSVSAVKSRLHRARRELAGKWNELENHSVATKRKPYETPAF